MCAATHVPPSAFHMLVTRSHCAKPVLPRGLNRGRKALLLISFWTLLLMYFYQFKHKSHHLHPRPTPASVTSGCGTRFTAPDSQPTRPSKPTGPPCFFQPLSSDHLAQGSRFWQQPPADLKPHVFSSSQVSPVFFVV